MEMQKREKKRREGKKERYYSLPSFVPPRKGCGA